MVNMTEQEDSPVVVPPKISAVEEEQGFSRLEKEQGFSGLDEEQEFSELKEVA